MPRIYVDSREFQSGIPDLLKELGAILFTQQLTVGDYVVSEGVAVERKSVYDLINSIYDKRFFDQLSRLREAYTKAFILVEGNLETAKSVSGKSKLFNSALISAVVDYDVNVLFSSNKRESSEILFTLARKYQEDLERKPISLHSKPKFESIEEMQLYLVQSLPQVGVKTASKLLKEFSTVRNMCNGNIADFEKILGSRKKAELLYKILNTKFSNSNTNKSSSITDFVK
ncbi:MAG: 3'-flap repair endonuclease Xpf [Metallosphaera sp.]|uniref:3'-flap repair endonuclease Xpf n=1 Tax=Metallosphaera sp. TaxID=2020860 RepID=UPI00316516C5